MSTGNKKPLRRKIKRVSEKDKRMAQLENEIARLEEENNKLKRDSVEYENRLAAFAGPTRLGPNIPAFNRILKPSADVPAASKLERSFTGSFRSDDAQPAASVKRKLRIKTLGSLKNRDTRNFAIDEAMPVEDVSCPQKQIIKKFVQSVSCPNGRPKRKQEVKCPSVRSKRISKCGEKVACSETESRKPKSCRDSICSGNGIGNGNGNENGNGKCRRTVQKVPCVTKEKKYKGCPKCENNRIEKLECEVYQLRREIEGMKHERKAAEKAVQRAILRGARALGGRFKPIVPESIEKLLDSCESNASSVSTAASVTCCGRKAEMQPCGIKREKKEAYQFCEASCAN